MRKFLALALISGILAPVQAVPPNLPEPKPIQFKIPKTKRFVLSNGIIVHLLEDKELPQIQLSGFFKGGAIYDAGNKTGLSGIFSAVLPNGGTKRLDPDALTRELELMGSSIGASGSEEHFSVSFFSLTRNFDWTLGLFSEILREPRLDAKKLDIEKKKIIGDIERRNDDPMDIARREFRRMLYGPQSPWGRRIEKETIGSISRKDLVDYHARYFRPAGLILAVSGDITEEALKAKLEAQLGSSKWSGQAAALPSLEPVNPENRRVVYLVDKPAVQQSSIRMGHFGVKRHNPDHFALEVMNEILGGGGFASRLIRNVRSRKGLAYSVGSGLTEPGDYGVMIAGIGTKTKTTSKAIKEVLAEIQSMKDAPPTEEELRIAKDGLINSFYANFRYSQQIVNQTASMEYYGYPADWLEKYQARLSVVSAEEVVRASTKYLKPDHALMVVVGNRKDFDEDLSVWGPLKLLDPETGLAKDAQGTR